MGFWNALSVLAPVAPAMSDAKDLRTARQQDAAKFASDQALAQARLTVDKLAAQEAQQRVTQGNAPSQIPGTKDYYSAAEGSWMRPSLVNGEFKAVKIPGQAPADELKQATKGLKDAFAQMGQQVPTGLVEDLAYRMYGGTGSFNAMQGLGVPKSVALEGPDGKPFSATFWGGHYYDAQGGEIASPKPYEKPAPTRPLSPAVRYTNLLAKQILASQKKGPPLTPEETADLTASKSELTLNGISTATARAVENARYGITNVTDDSGEDVAQTRLNAANAANAGTPFAAGVVGAPSGLDKKNQMLAVSALQQVNRMESILNRDPNLTGPGAGQLTQLQTWLGTQDPDAQAFLMSSLLGSEHGVAVFGGRNIHTIQDLQNTLGSWRTNPAALKAALQVIRETMTPWATAGGRLPAPRNAAPPASVPGAPKTAADYLKSVGVQ